MGYRLRELEAESKFSRELSVQAIGRAVPMDKIKLSLEVEGIETIRERKLNMAVVVLLVISINLYTHLSIGHVMRKPAQGLRFIWCDPDYELPEDSAITYRRYQLGEIGRASCRERV